jgi:hypothetical protein
MRPTFISRLWFGLLALLTLGTGRQAYAARAYLDSPFQSVQTLCPVTNTAVVVTQTGVGYFTDPAEPFPYTGDVTYVRAFAYNVSGCVNDAVGFEFFLPDGASLAVNTTFPVLCYRGKFDGTSPAVESVPPNAANSSCSQVPQVGANGGSFFGYSALPPAWYLEIQVPVVFNKQLFGIAGPNSHRLAAAATSAYGTMWPSEPVTSFYRPQFQNLTSSNVSTSGAHVQFDLSSYFGAGQVSFEYGASSAFGSATTPAPVSNTAASFPVSAPLIGLNQGTTYFWRGRFVTPSGAVFTSSTQTFTTAGLPLFGLNVTTSGSGSVNSAPSGIGCGQTCSTTFAQGTTVTLTATPSVVAGVSGTFLGWSGACTGTGPCVLTMNATKSVTAAFTFLREQAYRFPVLAPRFPW